MIGWRELLIVLVIVLLVFGTKRLVGAGKDLSEGIKAFKKGLKDDPPPAQLGSDHREPPAGTGTGAEKNDVRKDG